MSAGPATETAPSSAPTTEASPPRRRLQRDQIVVLRDVGWGGFTKMLRVRGDRGRPRMLYLDGDVHLMSPGHPHERDKERLGTFVVEVAVGLDRPIIMAGSTIYRRRKKEAGIEPDQSYYLENTPRVRNKKSIRLPTDPPPDLSIEVVYHHAAAQAVEISRRLGIPEVWICTEKGLRFLVLGPKGRYSPSKTSRAFPWLGADEVFDWIRQPDSEATGDLDWIKALRRWVQDTFVPRARNAPE